MRFRMFRELKLMVLGLFSGLRALGHRDPLGPSRTLWDPLGSDAELCSDMKSPQVGVAKLHTVATNFHFKRLMEG